jgi:hypothetical protein
LFERLVLIDIYRDFEMDYLKTFKRSFFAAIEGASVKAIYCFFLEVSESWLQKTLGPIEYGQSR